MSIKLSVNSFMWIEDTSKFDKDFIKSHNEGIAEGNVSKVDAQYPEELHELHKDLPFLSETKNIEKVEKLITNLHEKSEYLINIRYSKQALNNGLILNKKSS